jgi:hypothetical protein
MGRLVTNLRRLDPDRARRLTSSLAAALVLLLGATTSFPAHAAGLRDEARRLADRWRAAGAEIHDQAPRFLAGDQSLRIALPPPPSPEPACTTIAILGSPAASFSARIVDENALDGAKPSDASGSGGGGGTRDGSREPAEDDDAKTVASMAGAIVLERCDHRPLARVRVAGSSGRSALEVIVAFSDAPLPPLVSALPQRAAGVHGSQPEPGELPPLAPPSKRADVAERRSEAEGGAVDARVTLQASVQGGGSQMVSLDAGCHRYEVFALDPRAARPSRKVRLDVDAELRGPEEEVLARDRSEAPDARLFTCVGEDTAARLVFAGAPPRSQVLVTHARWELPEALPWTWGETTRARMASAVFARKVALSAEGAVLQAQGPSGRTPVPVALEPGACYVAVAAAMTGTPRAIGLRATIGAAMYADDRGVGGEASAVGFCTGSATRGRLEVEARGTAVAWGLALFRVRERVWQGVR